MSCSNTTRRLYCDADLIEDSSKLVIVDDDVDIIPLRLSSPHSSSVAMSQKGGGRTTPIDSTAFRKRTAPSVVRRPSLIFTCFWKMILRPTNYKDYLPQKIYTTNPPNPFLESTSSTTIMSSYIRYTFVHTVGVPGEQRAIRLVDEKSITAVHLNRLLQYRLFSKKNKSSYTSSLVFYKYDNYRRYREDKNQLSRCALKPHDKIDPYSFIIVKRCAAQAQ